jgi:hypothetical protein
MTQHHSPNPDSPYSIRLLNKEGYFIDINISHVSDLQIEDNIQRWWSVGYIDIKNSFDFMEKNLVATGHVDDTPDLEGEALYVNSKTKSPYIFRNDGTDVLQVRFFNPNAKDDSHHTMGYDLSVYSVEDLPSSSQPEKRKRLYFYDERYHILNKSNIAWSTADLYDPVVPGLAARNALESGREIKTGLAIRYLLVQALGEEELFADSWDEGSTDIFYTSPSNGRCVDDLNYLLSQYVSSSTRGLSKAFLTYDRSLQHWRLDSLHDIFKTAAVYDDETKKFLAGARQQDQYKLVNKTTGGKTEVAHGAPSERIPIGGDGAYTNQHAEESNIIKSIKFNEMTSVDNINYMVSQPVHLHDNNQKKFYINQSDHSLSSVYTEIGNIVDNLVHDKTAPITPSMNIEKTRQSNSNIIHSYSSGNTHTDSSLRNLGINNSVFNSIMLSNGVEFVVPGQSWRQSGRFISIDPDNDTVGNKYSGYHNKVFGQYLVMSIVHRLKSGTYTNKLVAIKPYNHRPVHFDPDVNNEPETPETYNKSLGEFFSQPIE